MHIADLNNFFSDCIEIKKGAWIVGAHVTEPERFGVINRDANGVITSLEEKPKQPKSNIAAIGLYFYDSSVVEKAKSLKPSARGELEIMDLNQLYFEQGNLNAKYLSRGATWMDVGQFESLLDCSNFIRIVEKQMGLKIGCIEEAAFVRGRINSEQLQILAKSSISSSYGEYLQGILAGIKYSRR